MIAETKPWLDGRILKSLPAAGLWHAAKPQPRAYSIGWTLSRKNSLPGSPAPNSLGPTCSAQVRSLT